MLAASAASLSASRALAAITPSVQEFTEHITYAADITAGPDGNLWFIDQGKPPAIGRITVGGAITEYPLPEGAYPSDITSGPDGNLWFTTVQETSPSAIGRVTPSGAIAELEVPAGSRPLGIATGADGKLWFTDAGNQAIGVLDPTNGEVTEFPSGLGEKSIPSDIAAGPDGKLWFVDTGTPRAIGSVDPATHAISEFSSGLNFGTQPYAITAGPDGRMWFSDEGTTKTLGAIDPATGVISEPSIGLTEEEYPYGVATGPEGALWFGNEGAPLSWFGRYVLGGVRENFVEAASHTPEAVIAGPDGNMWFTVYHGIARVTTPPLATTASAAATTASSAAVNGTVEGHSQPSSFHIEYGPLGGATTAAPEQSLGTVSGSTAVSATLSGLQPATSYQARVVATNPTGTAAGAFLTFKTPAAPAPALVAFAALTKLRISPSAFVAARRGTTVTVARKRRTGATVSYSANRAGAATFTIMRLLSGRRHGRSCVKPTRRNRGTRHCTRFAVMGAFVHIDTVGYNRFHFTGRLNGRRLAAGHYRLRAVPFGIAPNGAAAIAAFAIKRH